MRALVLGGSVFVGRRLVEALTRSGAEVTVLNRGRTPSELPEGVARLTADRTDPASMRAALEHTRWDAVYDVSGFVMAAGGSDIESLLDLVDGRVGAYVYISSIMAYDQSMVGPPTEPPTPWTEDLPTNPDGSSSYGGFKALAEQAMLERHRRTGFPATILRPAAIYGPHNNIFDMETPMFLRLLRHLPILLPHRGSVTGSYGHVDDLCDLAIAAATTAGATGRVVNATGEAVSAETYVHTLAGIVGEEPDIVMVPDTARADTDEPLWSHLFERAPPRGARHDGGRHPSGSRAPVRHGRGPRRHLRLVRGAWRSGDRRGRDRPGVARHLGLRCRGPVGPSAAMTRPSDDAIWASIATTLREAVLPAVGDEWARQSVIQLVGLAEYARSRPADDTPARRDRLRVALGSLEGNPLVGWRAGDDDPEQAAARALVAAVGRTDADADAVRNALRPVLLADLDADLSATESLDAAFRGRLPDA